MGRTAPAPCINSLPDRHLADSAPFFCRAGTMHSHHSGAPFRCAGAAATPPPWSGTGAAQYAVNSRRLGEPLPGDVTLLSVAPDVSAPLTVAGEAVGLFCR
jgi:hypothetical protein